MTAALVVVATVGLVVAVVRARRAWAWRAAWTYGPGRSLSARVRALPKT